MESKGTAVVWTLPGMEPPEELSQALTRGGLRMERVTSPYLAVAHLCNLERSRPGESRNASGALVLVQPETLPHVGQVCEIASRYAPHTRSWLYTRDAKQRLRAVTPQDVETWLKAPGGIEAKPVMAPRPAVKPARPAVAASPKSAPNLSGSRTSKTALSGPKLRLAGEGGVQQGAESADLANGEVEPARPRQVLSPEELEMLLDEPSN